MPVAGKSDLQSAFADHADQVINYKARSGGQHVEQRTVVVCVHGSWPSLQSLPTGSSLPGGVPLLCAMGQLPSCLWGCTCTFSDVG